MTYTLRVSREGGARAILGRAGADAMHTGRGR
jgi:hypothetical protein